jgi:RNA polymerase sigma-70 factor (ECF subfamily)
MAATDVTRALRELSRGDPGALDRLFPLVYEDLRELAHRALRDEATGHTLTPTGLVHEAYLRLVQLDRIGWQGRAHFFGTAAQVMRRVLIGYARMRKAEKRGGSAATRLPIENVVLAARERPEDLLALDEAMERLEQLSPRQARIVECRFFADMNIEATATALGISPATVKREWTAARAFLNRELVG